MSIIITGGSSMVGRHLQRLMPNALYLSSKDVDLENYDRTYSLFYKHKARTVIHLAAKVGGILDNINNPVDFYERNVLINTNTLRAAHKTGCKQFIGVLSTCAYPDSLLPENYPLKEELLHLGPPAPTNLGYGYAKRGLAVQIDAYNKQFKTNYGYLIPCNLYSQHDHFEGDKMHFVSSLIQKIHTAIFKNEKSIKLFGTGKPLRQFMYANDLARAIYLIYSCEKKPFAYNIASSENLSIEQIAKIALKSCNAEHLEIEWDKNKPDGQFRKDASSEKFLKGYDFEFTSLAEGIKIVYQSRCRGN